MNNILPDMYDTSDFQQEKEGKTTVNVKTTNRILKEVEINGSKFYSVDPVEFAKMENQLKSLKQRIDVVDQRVKMLDSIVKDKDIMINQLRRELDNKISYS